MDQKILTSVEGFDWDEGNRTKNAKHDVEWKEIEEIFFSSRLLVIDDIKHSKAETRYIAYGSTSTGRVLTVIFTLRGKKIRPISARDSNTKEKVRYEEKES
ncbi:MAG: BrnT family toxin [Bacteroidota bacterium]|nr:BrnT family toxin [Bacteroidota bacterium]